MGDFELGMQKDYSSIDRFWYSFVTFFQKTLLFARLEVHSIKWKNVKPAPGCAYKPTEIEHIANVLTHGIWIIPAVLGALELVWRAKSSTQELVAWVYGGALISLFFVSTIFHGVFFINRHRKLKNVLHRCDRAMIYVFIAGSYFPWLHLAHLAHPVVLRSLQWCVWCLAAMGIIYQQMYHERYKCLETFLYIVMGLGPSLVFCLLFLYFATCCAIGPKTTQENTELFKYSPTDEYTLPEDIDDDKPPVNFQGDVKHAQIVNLENKNHGQGKFKYSLQTQNGIEITQVGKLKDENTFVVSGSYSYTGADGKRYRVRYTADEFGYHPITELDVEFPELEKNNNENLGFQFLKQNIDFDSRPQNNGPYGGDAQIGDDYSYNGQKGYNYEPPEKQYLPPTKEKRPSNFYLPVP